MTNENDLANRIAEALSAVLGSWWVGLIAGAGTLQTTLQKCCTNAMVGAQH